MWIKFLKAKSEEDLKMVYDTKNQAIKEAVNVVLSLNKDKKMRTLALQRENALREYRSEMNAHIAKGIKEGIKKGKKEGEQKEKIEIAKNLLNMGFNNDQIMKATGLSLGDIEKLK
jgi:predicted transposase/invertase (TIGR01784 family)